MSTRITLVEIMAFDTGKIGVMLRDRDRRLDESERQLVAADLRAAADCIERNEPAEIVLEVTALGDLQSAT